VAWARWVKDPSLLAGALRCLSQALVSGGRNEEALSAAQEAVAVAKAIQEKEAHAAALNASAEAHLASDRPDLALLAVDKGLALAREAGFSHGEAGMDSLSAVEFRNRLQREFQMNLPAALMFDHPSITALTQHLVEESKAVPPADVRQRKPKQPRQRRPKARALPGRGPQGPVQQGPSKRQQLLARARLSLDLRVEQPCIAGTWEDWAVHEMTWNPRNKCYQYNVELGSNGWESFQILSKGDWRRCVYPDTPDGGPHADSTLCGPDDEGHGKNFTIGRHASDRGAEGDRYEVKLFLQADNSPGRVDWVRTLRGTEVPESNTTPYIVGTWSGWAADAMDWNGDGQCYEYEVEVGSAGWESFQILMNREWSRCLHPDRRDGCPHHPHALQGPDDGGHGKNWTIGKHPLDKAAAGSRYLVQLFLRAGGGPDRVDWVPL